MDKKELKRYIVIAFLVIAVCFIVKNFSLFGHIISVLYKSTFALLLGLVIAYIFNIILTFFEKKYFPKSDSRFVQFSRRPVCLVVSFLCAVGIIVLVLTIVIPEIFNAVKLVTSEIPPFLNQGRDYVISMLDQYPDIQKEVYDLLNEFDFKTLDWTSITSKAADILQNGVLGIISSAVGIVGAVAGTTANIVVAIIFAIYVLLRKDKLIKDINRIEALFLSDKHRLLMNKVFRTANETFQSFFVGQFVEALILGCLCFIGMTIIRLPYAGMSGTLVGVTALIPIVGAFLGMGISAFIIFTVSPTQALIFIIFLIILQQLENNIIYPKVVGNSVGLPGIWVLAAVTIGAGLGGVPGMIVGVPLTATIYKLLFEYLDSRENKSDIAVETDNHSGNKSEPEILSGTESQVITSADKTVPKQTASQSNAKKNENSRKQRQKSSRKKK